MNVSIRIIYILSFLAAIITIGCSEGPKNEDARINESMVVKKDVEERNYEIDSAGSFISWSGTNDRITHYGVFHIDHGYLTFKDSLMTGGAIFIRLAEINILDLRDNPSEKNRLASLIKSTDFFNAEKFPLAKFEIDSVKPITGSNNKTFRSNRNIPLFPTDNIYGTLSIKGISHALAFQAKIDIRYYTLQGSAEFRLNRHDWHLEIPDNFQSVDEGTIPDSIDVGFDIIANAR